MSEVKVTWLGHSCFRLEYKGASLILDPFADGSVPGAANIRESAEAVYCSHGHFDHNAADLVSLTGKPLPEDVSVTEYSLPHDDEGGKKRGPNTVRKINFGGITVVHMGDAGCLPGEELVKELEGCSVLLIPVGGFFTIDAKQAVTVAEMIKPRCAVPMHYRGEGFGFDKIGTCDEFVNAFPAPQYLAGSSFVVTEDGPCGVVVPELG